MTEPLGTNDILSIMKTFGISYNELAKEMKISRQSIYNALVKKSLTENADYRFRLLATYILKDYFHTGVNKF